MGWTILVPQNDVMLPDARAYIESRGHKIVLGGCIKTEDVIEKVKEVKPDAILIGDTKCTRVFFEAASPNLKCLARFGAGFDTVDLAAADEYGVKCVYAPVGNSFSVVELVTMHLLHASLNLTKVRARMMEDFTEAKHNMQFDTVTGKTLGIVGVGNIGSRVAKRGQALGMNVIAYDPYKKAADFPEGVRVIRDFDELLQKSDFVTLHVPNTPKTAGMMNREAFAKMKPTAYLINTARGTAVVEKDLLEAVKTGVIAGAGLDVNANEPLSPDREVLHTEGIYVTPHLGGSTVTARKRVSYMCAIGLCEAAAGEPLSWEIPRNDYSVTYDDVRPEEEIITVPDILNIGAH